MITSSLVGVDFQNGVLRNVHIFFVSFDVKMATTTTVVFTDQTPKPPQRRTLFLLIFSDYYARRRWNPEAGWVDRSTMERGKRGYPLCRFCNEEVPSARRTFCSNGCVHEHKVRGRSSSAPPAYRTAPSYIQYIHTAAAAAAARSGALIPECFDLLLCCTYVHSSSSERLCGWLLGALV